MSWLKSIVKKMMAPSPYRLSKGAANRFSAIEDSLRQLANSSFAPTLVIDGGAHTGEFSLAARAVFPEAVIHMIEPQPACAAALCSLRDGKGFFFHPVAITARAGDVRMVVQPSADTGAHVAWDTNPEEANIVVAGRTLDDFQVCMKPLVATAATEEELVPKVRDTRARRAP